MSGGAASLVGARFTPPAGFDTIYLAEDPITAFVEVSALIWLPGGPVPIRAAPWVVISVDEILNHVLDLTDPSTLTALDTTAQEMTGTWAAAPQPPTQILGQLAFDSGRISGISIPQTRHG